MMPDEVEQRVREMQREALAEAQQYKRARQHPQAWWLER